MVAFPKLFIPCRYLQCGHFQSKHPLTVISLVAKKTILHKSIPPSPFHLIYRKGNLHVSQGMGGRVSLHKKLRFQHGGDNWKTFIQALSIDTQQNNASNTLIGIRSDYLPMIL